jgi:hypothetical protein
MFPLILSLSAALAAGPKASSTQTVSGKALKADLALDGLLSTSWAEGASGAGEGEWVEVELSGKVAIQSVSVWPGNLSEGAKSFREYSRPRQFQLYVDGAKVGEPVHVQDRMQRVDVPLKDVTGRTVRVAVEQVYEGIVFSDMHIAELAVNFVEQAGCEYGSKDPKTACGDELRRYDQWVTGGDYARNLKKYEEEAQAAYDAHKAAEFGDADALAFLSRAAAEGPAFTHGRVGGLVAPGFRAQALRSDSVARYALRKLKDPNGIPAMELAMLRAVGAQQDELTDIVQIFRAYQELVGGGDRNVPYWGQSGWEPGAMRGFGEPLSLAIDRNDRVYLADTGNNRVQVYADNGRPERQWGPPADITDQWFDRGRTWYVSGAAPGEKPGEFSNPLDIEIIPEKESDGFATIDAKNRVQVFDSEGRMIISWVVNTRERPEPGLGGTAYLAWEPKSKVLVAIVQDEAVSYTLDSEEVARWNIKDGTPNAVVAMPKGYLLLAYGDQVIRYSMDGFRHGTVIDKTLLGEGFEDMDLAIDEEGKLWIATDMGWAYKFKRPSKVELAVRALPRNLKCPRIGVREGIVYVTSEDSIRRVDVLQVKLDQEAAEREAKEREAAQ